MATQVAISEYSFLKIFMHPQILSCIKTGFYFACHVDADMQADKKQKETELSVNDQLCLSLSHTQNYREIPRV